MSVIEVAISALATNVPASRTNVLHVFDSAAQAIVDQFLALSVDETYLDLLRRSIDDIRLMLADGGQPEGARPSSS